ncbi:unnamed protein product [Calypogeia fissa]
MALVLSVDPSGDRGNPPSMPAGIKKIRSNRQLPGPFLRAAQQPKATDSLAGESPLERGPRGPCEAGSANRVLRAPRKRPEQPAPCLRADGHQPKENRVAGWAHQLG